MRVRLDDSQVAAIGFMSSVAAVGAVSTAVVGSASAPENRTKNALRATAGIAAVGIGIPATVIGVGFALGMPPLKFMPEGLASAMSASLMYGTLVGLPIAAGSATATSIVAAVD